MSETLPERAAKVLTHNVPFQPVVMERGQGCRLYDTNGKAYLDFAAGIAVASLGHAPPVISQALCTQAEKLLICQASYVTAPRVELAELLVNNSGLDKAYFCNSGTEAVEASLKMARKWAHENKGENCKDIIAFRKSFHGRTYGASSVTAKALIQPEFGPYLPGVHFADFNDLESVKALLNERICAIILEPVQGEGGVTPADPDFMTSLRALCNEHNIALILDEIQSGMGRIGTLFAHMHYAIEPDILCLAKGMGGGFPVGALLAKDKFACAFSPGAHGTTYGGNALACNVAKAVIGEIMKPGFMDHVLATGAHMKAGLEDLAARSNKITQVRGLGLMLGAELSIDVKKALAALRDNGMLATQAGASTLRLTPPLIVTKDECDEALGLLDKTLKDL